MPIPSSWELTSIGEKGLEIKLKFKDAASVSQGDYIDTVYLQMELSEFEDSNGQKLQESIVKQYKIPAQIADEEEAEAVESQSESLYLFTQGASFTNAIICLILSASLYQLLGMINGLQIVTHLAFFNVKLPGNANLFNQETVLGHPLEQVDTPIVLSL